jgi:hypothetical protein
MIELWQHLPQEHLDARQAWLWDHELEHRRLAGLSGDLPAMPLDDLWENPGPHDTLHRALAARWGTGPVDFASVAFDDPVQWLAWHHAHAQEHLLLRSLAVEG